MIVIDFRSEISWQTTGPLRSAESRPPEMVGLVLVHRGGAHGLQATFRYSSKREAPPPPV
jgi:hypothetical protein